MSAPLNVAKCVRYLRAIGIEVSDALATQWTDSECVHRYLAQMKRPAVSGWDCWCERGHRHFLKVRRGRRLRTLQATECCACGARWTSVARRYDVALDGTVTDYRPPDERWKALDAPPPPVGQDDAL